jgi:hypothetical protein
MSAKAITEAVQRRLAPKKPHTCVEQNGYACKCGNIRPSSNPRNRR